MPSAAGATKVKKSDGAIQAGTASTANMTPLASSVSSITAGVDADEVDVSREGGGFVADSR